MEENESPCVGICEIDPESETCIGCGRSADEIFGRDDQPADSQTRPASGPTPDERPVGPLPGTAGHR